MGTRRSHNKSRSGCVQCKSRRIKCDERAPQCSNCARREIACELTARRPHRPPLTASAGRVLASTSPSLPTPPGQTSSSISPFEPSPVDGSVFAPFSGLDVVDLELLHHYTTYTYKTLPSGASPDQHEIWQIQVVQLGFRHEFLLRGILTVSALHLAYLRPNRNGTLSLRASSHRSIAVRLFHETLNRVSTSNCVALFAFSCIVVALTFATSKNLPDHGRDTSPGVQKEILDWFYMVRGCNSVVQTQWQTLSQSFLAPLLQKGMMHETAASQPAPDTGHVTDLLRLCSYEGLVQDREAANGCALAIHELLNTYTQVSLLTQRKQDVVPVVFVWPIAIPQSYLALLSERRPEAMVILAHYAALLQGVDEQWYMEGWARYLVQQIDSALGAEWASWLSWPKDVTGVRAENSVRSGDVQSCI